ncbi:hypothetical protein J6590_018155 [Homalodisca vitripennis]|nr:hypothetical protein J6590_018155 [Homalodisca vitripennis]
MGRSQKFRSGGGPKPVIWGTFCVLIANEFTGKRNFTKFDSGRVEGTNVMLHSLDKKEKEQNRASLKRIIDTTIFCGENEILLRGHWATDGRKPFRKGGQFSSVARVQIKLTVGKCTGKTLLIRSSAALDFTD